MTTLHARVQTRHNEDEMTDPQSKITKIKTDFSRPVMECERTSFQSHLSEMPFLFSRCRIWVPLRGKTYKAYVSEIVEPRGLADKRRPSAWLCDGKNAVRVTGPRERWAQPHKSLLRSMTVSYTPPIQRQRDRSSSKNTGYRPASQLIFLSAI